ncbi:MAG: nicotinate-nucleotide adenylyltransferase [Paludibacteraceae bacterium]|nr:nicotinate-nucleotide adenylyltransferase [Paludibacteraceae bacterium]
MNCQSPNKRRWKPSADFWLDKAACNISRVGLFFGSFNPIHNGHLNLARTLLENTGLEQVWLVVSPQNPFKLSAGLADDNMRYEMAWLATQNLPGIEVCGIELELPTPSYTIRTLDALRVRYPHIRFTLLMGADNWLGFPGWQEYERILASYEILIYPRTGSPMPEHLPEGVRCVEAPTFDLSATQIREAIGRGEPIGQWVPEAVAEYIRRHRLYR